jgi:hypothetical protein
MIRPVAAAQGGASVRRAGGAARGFAVPRDGEETVAGAGAVAGTEGVAMAGLLALQEWPAERQGDRAARRHGEALLAELAALQRALLAGGEGDVARLAELAARVPAAEDPGLRAAVAAVALRARIELARREAAAERRDGGG